MMRINETFGIAEQVTRADKSAVGAIMVIDKIIRTWKNSWGADQAAVGAINRPLQGAGVVCYMPLSAVGANMCIEYFMRTTGHPSRADQSAVGAINRPLQGAGVI
jgi:hypothetical protein